MKLVCTKYHIIHIFINYLFIHKYCDSYKYYKLYLAPRCSGPNEVFISDKPPASCPEKTCRTMLDFESRLVDCRWSLEWNYGCVCKRGYVRDDNNTCILIKHCPNCKPN